jgi:hypothetical protein
LKEGHLEKSKLAGHAYNESYWVVWHEARILEIETNNRYRKYKESAHLACLETPISQPILDIPPISFPLIIDEVISKGSP